MLVLWFPNLLSYFPIPSFSSPTNISPHPPPLLVILLFSLNQYFSLILYPISLFLIQAPLNLNSFSSLHWGNVYTSNPSFSPFYIYFARSWQDKQRSSFCLDLIALIFCLTKEMGQYVRLIVASYIGVHLAHSKFSK